MLMQLAEQDREQYRRRRARVAEVVKRHVGSYRAAYAIAGWLVEGWDEIKRAVESDG